MRGVLLFRELTVEINNWIKTRVEISKYRITPTATVANMAGGGVGFNEYIQYRLYEYSEVNRRI